MTDLGMEIRISDRAARQVAAGFERAPDIVREEMLPAVWEGTLLLEREIQERTPVGIGGGGGLRGSIAAREPAVLADNIVGEVGTAAAHAIPVEIGSRPHFPPITPLVDWAQAKLGLSLEEAEHAGWGIAFKIAAHGTEGQHMFEEGFKAGEARAVAMIEAAAGRIGERMAEGGR